MKSRNLQGIFTIFTALLIIILGAGAALAQGKGKGGDKNGGGEKHGGGEGGKSERQQPQPRAERPQVQRQQPEPRVESPQAKRPQTPREQPRDSRFMGPPIREQQPQQVRRPDVVRGDRRRPDLRQIPDNRVYEQRQNRNERGQDDIVVPQQPRDYRNSQTRGDQRQIPSNSAWPNNYGYQRSREVHARNAERKAWRDEEKALRRNVRGNRSYAYEYQYDPYYQDNRYVYPYPQHLRANVLRNLIANVLGSDTGYNNNYYSQYQPVYYGDPYYYANYSGNYYDAYPQYQSYAATPYYYSYQPYGYGYAPQYGGDPYYADNYYSNVSFSNYANSTQGGGFLQQLFSKLLALGYDRGYNDGLNARQAGYGDQYYSDPYAYQNTNYVPYSYSLGENRQSLSDGYELGYNDALYDQRGSYPYQNGLNGNFDLVSVLLGNILGRI